MILSTSNAIPLTAAGSLTDDPAPPPSAGWQLPDHTSCHLQIDRVIREIEPSVVREFGAAVLQSLLFLSKSAPTMHTTHRIGNRCGNRLLLLSAGKFD